MPNTHNAIYLSNRDGTGTEYANNLKTKSNSSESGTKCYIDGVEQTNDTSFTSFEYNVSMPYPFQFGTAVIYNNEIHILGGLYDSDKMSEDDAVNFPYHHYKFDGYNWTKLPDMPFDFYSLYRMFSEVNGTNAIVYDNKIYVPNDSAATFWAWDGATWSNTGISVVPLHDATPIFFVYNNEIYAIATDEEYSICYNEQFKNLLHYDASNQTWVVLSDLSSSFPDNVYNPSVCIFNNEIHMFSGTNHYKCGSDGVWTNVNDLSELSIDDGGRGQSSIVYNNKIYLVYYGGSTYVFNNNTWTFCASTPYDFTSDGEPLWKDGCVLAYNDYIYMLGGNYPNHSNLMYRMNIHENTIPVWSQTTPTAYKLNS